ncbi:hypothetical protein QBC35DRAFT_388590 [Podospora australis]|uniref:Lytic polysaccharide monooxygenase n=1 Tax=Podospora australis TaxID=1536484 RepID=A0AAN6WQH1_9PEZI|nr:hypothetical protein QBC35DRAFT_388590 [Podospora australis]
MFTSASTAALAALLASSAHGHMIMDTPTPFNYKGTNPLVQVDPLNGANFPFPCQGNTEVVERTSVTAGGSQLVKFTGGAIHGGGSCQFAVTYENPPPADKSKWKTIYILIGGCPGEAAGNLPPTAPDADGRANSAQCGNDSGKECIRQFDIPFPKDLPNGNATFAWTWFNKIGNREIYMNCAPLSITGGSEDTAFFDDLPPLFLANIPGECTTNNGVLNIPNPGKFGKVLEQPAPDSEGSCPKAGGIPTFDGASDNGPPARENPAPVVSSSAPVVTAAPSATVAPSAPIESIIASVTERFSDVPAQETGIPVAAPIPEAPIDGGNGVTCSPDGAFFCIDSATFGHCVNGKAVPQAIAPGTTCSFGPAKRSAKFLSKLIGGNRVGPRA